VFSGSKTKEAGRWEKSPNFSQFIKTQNWQVNPNVPLLNL
jgi:hypothetical protein